mmetsp:Transcript_28369/g.69893  ORF Transcript_28369/g.69893 Transcript_28369/m.69893 type:complete len:94 (+) Transcript_28369:1460-1741(+)
MPMAIHLASESAKGGELADDIEHGAKWASDDLDGLDASLTPEDYILMNQFDTKKKGGGVPVASGEMSLVWGAKRARSGGGSIHLNVHLNVAFR